MSLLACAGWLIGGCMLAELEWEFLRRVRSFGVRVCAAMSWGDRIMATGAERTPSEQAVKPGEGYAGDVAPGTAWRILTEAPNAVLVDVRTQPEWVFVGIPDLSGLGKKPAFIPWQVFPSMTQNPEFGRQVAAAGAKSDQPVLFLCRSGARSKAAAIALTALGYTRAYNIAGGFEGPLDNNRHRGTTNGWKADGLPWLQD